MSNATLLVDAVEAIRAANQEWAVASIPQILVIATFSLYGGIGNSLILIIYGRKQLKQPADVLIFNLAVTDLIVCFIANPFYISMTLRKYAFADVIACKSLQMVCYLSVLTSVLLHTFISIDRYISVKQLHRAATAKRSAIIGCCAAWLTGLAFAAFAGTIYGQRTVRVPQTSVVGIICSFSDQYIRTSLPNILNITMLILFVACVVISCVCYARVGQVAWRQRRWRRKIASETTNSMATSKSGTGPTASTASTSISVVPGTAADRGRQVHLASSDSTAAAKQEENSKTTMMLFAITVSFIISWIPFWTIGLVSTAAAYQGSALPLVLDAFIDFMKRMYLANSANNPIIFSFVSVSFRKEVTSLLKAFCCCSKRVH